MSPEDLLKRIEALALETGAYAIVRADQDQKAFEKALMNFGLSCYQEALEDAHKFRNVLVHAQNEMGELGKVTVEARALLSRT